MGASDGVVDGVIDVWGQITTERMARAPWLAPLLRWTGGEGMASSVPATLAAMDESGVDMMLLAAWHGPEGDLISNAEVAAQVDAAPDRFRGLASVDLNDPMGAVRTIRTHVDGERFVGVRVVPWLWNLPPNDRRYYPVYAACIDAGVPFCTQIGHTGPLKSSETGRPIPYLEDVMLDFPELKIVGGHVGFPWVNELVTLAVKFPNFYIDTSAYALHRLPPDFIAHMKGALRGRVMFGANWPMLTPKQCLAGLDKLGLGEEGEAQFLSGAAKAVFNL